MLLDHPNGTGLVAIIEVRRDPAKLPHRIVLGGGKVRAGQVYVRHGSQVEEPTAAELGELQVEGDRARGEPPVRATAGPPPIEQHAGR